jgi:hypothetical protein
LDIGHEWKRWIDDIVEVYADGRSANGLQGLSEYLHSPAPECGLDPGSGGNDFFGTETFLSEQ